MENKYETLTQKNVCMKGKLKMNMQDQLNLMWEKNISDNRRGNTKYFTQVGQGSDKFLRTLSVQNAVRKKNPFLEPFGNYLIML